MRHRFANTSDQYRQHRITPVAVSPSVTFIKPHRPSRLAGFLEIGFAFGMKWSAGFTRLIPGLFTAATGLSSIFLLSLSLRTLPVGTGYAVWTGIGAAGTAVLGMAVLGDSTSPLRIVCIGLILAGVIGLKLVSES